MPTAGPVMTGVPDSPVVTDSEMLVGKLSKPMWDSQSRLPSLPASHDSESRATTASDQSISSRWPQGIGIVGSVD